MCSGHLVHNACFSSMILIPHITRRPLLIHHTPHISLCRLSPHSTSTSAPMYNPRLSNSRRKLNSWPLSRTKYRDYKTTHPSLPPSFHFQVPFLVAVPSTAKDIHSQSLSFQVLITYAYLKPPQNHNRQCPPCTTHRPLDRPPSRSKAISGGSRQSGFALMYSRSLLPRSRPRLYRCAY